MSSVAWPPPRKGTAAFRHPEECPHVPGKQVSLRQPRQPLSSSLLSELCLYQNVTSMETPATRALPVLNGQNALETHHFAAYVVVNSFLLLMLSRIPLQGWTPICSSVFQLMGIQVVSYLGYCESCFSEHWGACLLLNHVFLQIHARKWSGWVIW